LKPVSELVYRPMRPCDEELEMMRDLFTRHGFPRGLEAYRWQYLEVPSNECFVQFVVDERTPLKKLAAVVACFALPFKLGDESGLGVQTNNVMTDEYYRGQRLFYNAVLHTFEYFRTTNLRFAYGFGNHLSGPAYIKHFGWKNLNPVPLLIKPLRMGMFMERLGLPSHLARGLDKVRLTRPWLRRQACRYTIDRRLRFDGGFDALWQAVREQICVGVERDRRFLQWRFADRPETNYQMLSVRHGEELLAYVVYGSYEKFGGRIGYILDFLHHPDFEDAGQMILRQACDALDQQQCDAILAWSYPHSPNHGPFRKAHFFPLPERFRPSKVYMAADCLDQGSARLILDRDNWFVSFADLDVV
jgi:hypothetical protein